MPTGLTGVLVTLFLTGTTLNVQSLMGVIMMVGIVVSNSILIVEFAHQLEAGGAGVREAIVTSCRIRLRPIHMTSLATVIGLVPMALKLGTGSEAYAPLAAQAPPGAALGYRDTRTFDLQDEPLPTAPLPALDQEIASAMRHRPDLASQSLQRDSAMSLARAARDLWLPTVGLAGGAGIVPYRQDGLADRYSALGINVSVPVFNGALFSAQRAAATDRMQIEDERLHDLQNRIARDVRLAWLDANTGRQQLDLTSQLLTEANEALDLAQARYKLGLGSIVELTQAQLNQTKAETDQATARYDYPAAIATLDFQSGARP
ncbi:MAG: efflux RND transporter permease subunit [Betaproteobacteria bacterium]